MHFQHPETLGHDLMILRSLYAVTSSNFGSPYYTFLLSQLAVACVAFFQGATRRVGNSLRELLGPGHMVQGIFFVAWIHIVNGIELAVPLISL